MLELEILSLNHDGTQIFGSINIVFCVEKNP